MKAELRTGRFIVVGLGVYVEVSDTWPGVDARSFRDRQAKVHPTTRSADFNDWIVDLEASFKESRTWPSALNCLVASAIVD
jgi:hypothetical protein